MIRYIFLYLISLYPTYCQELNSKVIINTDKLQSSEVMIFEEMQVAIEQFLNNNIWTNDRYCIIEATNNMMGAA